MRLLLRRCHYTGKLTSGAVFDSSYERRKPLTFKVSPALCTQALLLLPASTNL